MLIALALLAAPAGAQATAGDVYLADQSAGPGASGAIFRVDLASGAVTPLAIGPPLDNPADMAFGADGSLVVSDDGAAAIFRVDPATGTVTQVARGGELTDPWGVAFGPAGRLFVADVGFASPAAIVFRINIGKNEGAKEQFAAGPPMVDPAGIAREGENAFLVSDLNGVTGATDGIIHRVNAAVRGTPVEEVASGTPLVDPWGIAINPDGTVVIADANAFGGPGGLLALDPKTGTVTPLASTPLYTDPVDLAPLPGGTMLVADYGQVGPGALLSYDQRTGVTTSVASGAPLVDPSSVLVEPPLCGGKTATIVGSVGRDKLIGTHYTDVIAALDGNDVVKADRGNDLVCGGRGRDFVNGGQGVDELQGEGGKDRLIGSDGPDVLDGGPGRDRCNGKASHKDRAVACEKRIKIP
jgi:streptogramin lyase